MPCPVLLMVAHAGRVRVHVRTKITQSHQLFLAGVFKYNPLPRRLVADKHLVLRQIAVAYHRRRLQSQLADSAEALYGNQAVSAVVLKGELGSGIYRELLGAEKLPAVDLAVNDPAVGVTFALGVGRGDRFEIVVIF